MSGNLQQRSANLNFAEEDKDPRQVELHAYHAQRKAKKLHAQFSV